MADDTFGMLKEWTGRWGSGRPPGSRPYPVTDSNPNALKMIKQWAQRYERQSPDLTELLGYLEEPWGDDEDDE